MNITRFGFGNIAERLSYFLLVFVVAVTPVFFIPSTSFPFEGTKIALLAFGVLLSLCLFAVARIESQDVTIPNQLSLLAAWLLPLSYGLSALWNGTMASPFSGSGVEIDSLYFILLCAIAMTVTALVVNGAKRARLFAYAFLFSFAVLTLFQLIRLFGGAEALSFGNLFVGTAANLIGKWNEVAIFYGMAATVSLVLLAMRFSGVVKGVALLVLVISLFFVAVVNLNIVWWLLLLASLAVFVTGLLPKPKRITVPSEESEGTSKSVVLIAAAVFMVSLFYSLPASWIYSDTAIAQNSEPRNFLANAFGVVYLEARPSWDGTMAILKNVYGENALLGSGPGTFGEEWLKVKPLDINRTIFWNVDFLSGIGFIPTSFATTGLIGVIAWLLFLGAIVWAAVRGFILRSGDALPGATSLLSFTATAFLFTSYFFYTPGPVLLMLGFISAGLFFASLRGDRVVAEKQVRFEDNPRLGFVATLLAIVFFLGAAGSMFFIGTKYVSAYHFQKANIAYVQDGNLEKALQEVSLANTFSDSDRIARLAASIEITYLQQTLNNPDQTAETARAEFEKHFNAALAHAERATTLGPRDYQNWVMLGRVTEIIVPLGNAPAYERAVQAYEKAIALNPQSPVLQFLRGNLEIVHGDQKAARGFIEKSLEKKPDYSEAIFILAQMQIQEGNVPDAIKSVEAAVTINPENPVLFFQLGLLYYSQNRFAEAAAAFERAVAINKDYANAHYFLGLTYHRLKQNSAAIAQFEEVLRTNAGNEEVPKILENLKANRDPFASFDPPKSGDIRKQDGLPVADGAEL